MATKPVTISKAAFAFCRWSMAVLMWTGAIMRLPWLVAACAVIMALSAIFTVRRAPMVLLYTHTLNKIWPSGPEVVDELGMRFAHLVAFLMISVGLFLALSPGHSEFGWRFLWVVCIFKTAGAIGYCPVSRGFTCLLGNGGSCCKFLRKSGG